MNRAERRIMLRRRARTKKVIQGMCLFVVIFLGVLVLLFQKVECDSLTREINNLEEQIIIEEAESVRLKSELAAMVSTEKIEYYAEEVLGMVKAESNQITYIDLSEGDKIVVSGDKVPGEESKVVKALNSLVASLVNAVEAEETPNDSSSTSASEKEG